MIGGAGGAGEGEIFSLTVLLTAKLRVFYFEQPRSTLVGFFLKKFISVTLAGIATDKS